jgi:ABC-type Fe3+/spermidine/putrescine transport system ATPase subunit
MDAPADRKRNQLSGGEQQRVALTRPLYAQPACRFVAGFFGETNFLGATVSGTRDGLVTLDTAAEQLVRAPPAAAKPPAPGAAVACSIRPEAARILKLPGETPAKAHPAGCSCCARAAFVRPEPAQTSRWTRVMRFT